MARSQEVCFVVLIYYLFFPAAESKIFSKSLEDVSLIEQPTLRWNENDRHKRAVQSDFKNGKNASFIHSQNLTLTTISISLQGENDNEVFVTWTGVNNDVSIYFIL